MKIYFCKIILITAFLVGCSSNDGKMECPVGEHVKISTLTCIPDCTAGSAFFNGSCQVCPVATAPILDQSSCRSCSAGTFNNTIGATSCMSCAPGYYSNAGSTMCMLCAPGTYSASSGSATCNTCPDGTFASSSGSMSCIACPPGMVSAPDFMSCI